MYYNTPTSSRYHRIDGWRGYRIPRLAIAGASDTGTFDDSPCPSNLVKAEISRIQREVLRPLGIKSRTVYGNSSNAFCMKRWLVVPVGSFGIAAAATAKWLEEHKFDTDFVHDADLKELAQGGANG